VLRPSSLPHALAVVTAGVLAVLGSVVAGPAASATSDSTAMPSAAAAALATPVDADQPLVPRIRSITPDYVPEHGPIVIRGTVTNESKKTWTAVNVHGFVGSTPITTAAELAAAAQVPIGADVGHRITVSGTFASIPSLAPGESTTFKVRLPQATLPVTSPGVYWFGVHVLGDDGNGGPRVAVGRDRTFLPFVPASAVAPGQHEDAALVVPVRSGVVRGPDGTVTDPEQWGTSLRSGELHAITTLGRAARGNPLTWLVDPAVPDVVRRLARGNPARTLAAPVRPRTGDVSPSASPSTDSTADTGSGSAGATPSPATTRAAKHWLGQLQSLLSADSGEVLALPYGDLAVESAARNDRTLLREAFKHGARSLRRWGLASTPAVAPPDGRTTGDTVTALPRDTDVILPDTGVEGDRATVNQIEGRRVLVTSTGAAQGGPGPVDAHSSLALRQRILAEAALRLLDDQQPLVVELPTSLHRRIRPSFFTGLDLPWLRLTTLGGATAVRPTTLDSGLLREPSPDQPQLGPGVYVSAMGLLDQGQTLQAVLTDNHVLLQRLFEEVAGNASYAAAEEPYVALSRMRITAKWVRDNLDAIDLAAPPSVTLASTSGRFSAIVSNELDVPVTVKVKALTDDRLHITGGEAVTLPPHGRSSVLLNASTHQRGVHTVTLELTSRGGRPLVSAHDTFPMRAEQVSRLIWVIIGTGVGLLFAAIIVRLTRRALRARAARRTAA
jgi:hypothetical protein